MSNPTGDPPSNNLQGLVASLRSASRQSYQADSRGDQSPAQSTNRQSYDFNRSSDSPQPHHNERQASATMSPSFSPLNGSQSKEFSSNTSKSKTGTPTPAGDASTDRSASLLNLLKFSQPVASPPPTTQQQPPSMLRPGYGSSSSHSVHGRGISASDLIGSSMGKISSPTSRENMPSLSTSNHQDFLLKLLNQSNPPQPTSKESNAAAGASPPSQEQDTTADQISQKLADASLGTRSPAVSGDTRGDSPIRVFGSNDEAQPTPFAPGDLPSSQTQPKKDSIFTYVNPFEQLAASSPRNMPPKSANGDGHKRKVDEPSPGPSQNSLRRKLTPTGKIRQSVESPGHTTISEGPSKVEAPMGVGVPSRNTDTVAEALNVIGGQVDREVEDALAIAEEKEKQANLKKEELERAKEETLDVLEEKIHDAAIEVKHELEKKENKGLLEETFSAPVAEAVKDIIDEAAQGTRGDDWESANGEDTRTDDRVIPVYQFPMRPFVSIDIQHKDMSKLTVRDESLINIARLKKEFDQTDRTLATATNEFIVYASPKTGGLRVIRQDDGLAKHLFADTRDRIFNVSISTAYPASPSRGTQTIIATGLSGTVYWVPISRSEEDLFQTDMEKQGLIFPPSPATSDNSSGGQLKTRAKKSSRHPEYFAIGRGKSIQIIFPAQARESNFLEKGSTVDTEDYFRDRSLKITTGKAGKDFTFSEDDTVIVSLDKAGRLRFWDIRELVHEANASASTVAPIEIKTPLLSFATIPASEKAWPTSVLFVDKVRPYTKGIAQRYVIVGMKQNHTLQLWDLCLGKAVQELNFPHEKESDAICSIAYHPSSGMIVVGHPTRNSIYFIHLSAPKYNLPGLSQAKFIQRRANNDSTLPKPEATAIMSGIREYSFANKGDLRSVELVPPNGEQTRPTEDDEDPNKFELYIMHSKGVTCLGIKKEDLGWSPDSRVLHPVDSEKEGYIMVKELPQSRAVSSSEPSSVNGEALPHSTSAAPAPSKPPNEASDNGKMSSAKAGESPAKEVATSKSDHTASGTSNTNKLDKRKKKRTAASDISTRPVVDATSVHSLAPSSGTYAIAAQRGPLPSSDVAQNNAPKAAAESLPSSASDHAARSITNGDSINLGISGDFLDKELKKIEKGVSTEFNNVLSKELEALYRRLDEDKRIQDAAGAAKQDAILRLVSSTLGDNVEKALNRIIQAKIQQVVLPSISEVTASTLDKRITEVLTQQLHHAIPPLLKLALPEAISRGIQNRDVLRVVSDQVTSKLAGHVEREFSSTLHTHIAPAFKSLAVEVATKVSGETERRVREQLQKAEVQHHEDTVKIDQLTNLLRGLSETVHTMAAAQSQFQQEILKLQQERQASSSRGRSADYAHASRASTESQPLQKSPEQEEFELLSGLMNQGRFEECTIQVQANVVLSCRIVLMLKQWLQSDRQVAVFDNYLAHCDPAFVQQLSPLVSISVGAAVTFSLENKVSERLTWLENVLATLNPKVSAFP